jgi:multicomponent Na+:H+ antiporter subunit D
MVIGVLGAVGRDRLREILAFHMTSQMGYMVMGLGLFGAGGLTAGIFFLLHQIVVKTGLFLAAGAVEEMEGSGALDDLGGLMRRHVVLAAAFALSALSLAGLPPLSGFFGKLLLVQVAFADAQYLIGAVAVVVSLFTLLSMAKIWLGAFWGETPVLTRRTAVVAGGAGDEPPPLPAARSAPLPLRTRVGLVGPALTLALVSLAAGFGAEWLYQLSETAGELIADKSTYIDAVLGPEEVVR